MDLIKDQNKIVGRLCAMGRAQYSPGLLDGPGYIFTKDGFHWELDPIDQDQYGLTMDALIDCVEQLEKMGSAGELKKSDHIRDKQGWMNTGLVIQSKLDPRICCEVTFVDMDYEKADVNLRWYVDLFKSSQSAVGAPERSVDAEDLKAVERAQEMTKEIKTESIDTLFDLPIKDKSSATKVLKEDFDRWGFPLGEDVTSGHEGHVGVDALEKPKSEEGDKDRGQVAGTAVKELTTDPKGDGKDNKEVDGSAQSEVGGTDKTTELPAAKIKLTDPLGDGKDNKHVEETVETGVTGHVGLDAIEKPHSEEGDKDRSQVAGTNVDVKPGSPEKKPETMAGAGSEVGGTDKLDDVAASKVKPGTPESTPKVMAEKTELRKKQYEAYKLENKEKIEEARKKKAEKRKLGESLIAEDVKHPLKVVEHLKKHMEEAHRSVKKAHHLMEWAGSKMKESQKHLPIEHVGALHQHEAKMQECANHMNEAKKGMHEVCEAVSGIHMQMKKK